jgi:TusA-related sulfurtransferase
MSQTLDLRQTVCPFTQLRAIEAFHKLPEGGSLRILVVDPASVDAILKTVKGNGTGEVDVSNEAGAFVLTVLKRKV